MVDEPKPLPATVETPEPTIEERTESFAGALDDFADLVRKGGRIAQKLGKALASAEKVTGPMSRPLDGNDGKR